MGLLSKTGNETKLNKTNLLLKVRLGMGFGLRLVAVLGLELYVCFILALKIALKIASLILAGKKSVSFSFGKNFQFLGLKLGLGFRVQG